MLQGRGTQGGMGLFSSVSVIVGACIGSAIFSISGMTVHIAGAGAVGSWVLAALVMGAYGLIVTRLAVNYPRSGGIFVFPRLVFGRKAGRTLGFFSAWGYIVSNCIAIGFSAIVAGIYFAAGFPEFCGGSPETASLIASLVAMAVSLAILLLGGRRSQLMQNSLVLLLAAALVMYCVIAFCSDGFDVEAVLGASKGAYGKTGFLSAVPLAMVAYGGCVAIAFMISEVRNPSRNVPRSLWVGLGVVALLYSCVVIAIVGTLPVAALSEDPALRYSPLLNGGGGPASWSGRLVALSSILAQLTTIIVLTRINARAVQAMSADGFFPSGLARENSRGVLVPAVVLLTAVGVGICFLRDWAWNIITLGAVLNVVSMAITCAAAIKSAVTRDLEPRKRRSRVIFPVAVVSILLLCYLPDIVGGSRGLWIFTGATYLAGLAVYGLFFRTVRRLSGVVVHGRGVGHKHGIPTANLSIHSGQKLPQYGVWATKVTLDGAQYKGLTNVGLRPTDDDSLVPTVETLILGIEPGLDIYGYSMVLEFQRYIRPTRKFGSLDELKEQIDRDIESCR